MTRKDYDDLLVKWLKSAHALESTLASMLEEQAERASSFPEIKSRLQGHREESLRHANMVESCITDLGGDVSGLRTKVSKIFGDAQSKMLATYEDTLVRDMIVGLTSEQMEIASYRAIISLAKELGNNGVVDVCENILKDEEKMYDFLEENLEDVVVRSYELDLLTD